MQYVKDPRPAPEKPLVLVNVVKDAAAIDPGATGKRTVPDAPEGSSKQRRVPAVRGAKRFVDDDVPLNTVTQVTKWRSNKKKETFPAGPPPQVNVKGRSPRSGLVANFPTDSQLALHRIKSLLSLATVQKFVIDPHGGCSGYRMCTADVLVSSSACEGTRVAFLVLLFPCAITFGFNAELVYKASARRQKLVPTGFELARRIKMPELLASPPSPMAINCRALSSCLRRRSCGSALLLSLGHWLFAVCLCMPL